MIEHIDMNIGVLMDKLEEWKLLESTVVIFTSDNGMTRGGSGLMGFEGQPQVELGRKQDGSVMMSYNAGMKGLKGTCHIYIRRRSARTLFCEVERADQ